MKTATKKQAASATDKVDRQIRRARALLREIRATLEDLEDHRELIAAEARNAGKPCVPLRNLAGELGL